MSKFDTGDVDIVPIFLINLRSFILFFEDFNGSSTRRKDLQILFLKSTKKKKKKIENACGGDHF